MPLKADTVANKSKQETEKNFFQIQLLIHVVDS